MFRVSIKILQYYDNNREITSEVKITMVILFMIVKLHSAVTNTTKLFCGNLKQNSSETTIMIDHALQHNTSLQNANQGMDEMIGSGSSILTGLREQRATLKVHAELQSLSK